MTDKKKSMKHKAVVVVHCGCILNDLPWTACGACVEDTLIRGKQVFSSCFFCKGGKCHNPAVRDKLDVRRK